MPDLGTDTRFDLTRMKRILWFGCALFPVVLLAGCGSSGWPHYIDKRYHFSLAYPSDWTAPKNGTDETVGTRKQYVADFNGGDIDFRVLVSHHKATFPKIRNGEVLIHGQLSFEYHFVTIGGRRGMLVAQHTQGVGIDREYAYVSGPHWDYEFETANAASAFTKDQEKNFAKILDSFKFGSTG